MVRAMVVEDPVPPARAEPTCGAAPTVIDWARSQGWQVRVQRPLARLRFAAPGGAFVASWDPADTDRLPELVAALRRFDLVWPPSQRTRRRT